MNFCDVGMMLDLVLFVFTKWFGTKRSASFSKFYWFFSKGIIVII